MFNLLPPSPPTTPLSRRQNTKATSQIPMTMAMRPSMPPPPPPSTSRPVGSPRSPSPGYDAPQARRTWASSPPSRQPEAQHLAPEHRRTTGRFGATTVARVRRSWEMVVGVRGWREKKARGRKPGIRRRRVRGMGSPMVQPTIGGRNFPRRTRTCGLVWQCEERS